MQKQDIINIIVNQTPDFYNQTVQWGIVSSLIGLTIGIFFVIVGGLTAWFLRHKENGFPSFLILALSLLTGLLLIGLGASWYIEASYYPKAYFIRQLAREP